MKKLQYLQKLSAAKTIENVLIDAVFHYEVLLEASAKGEKVFFVSEQGKNELTSTAMLRSKDKVLQVLTKT